MHFLSMHLLLNAMEATCISYKETGSFSPTVINYLADAPSLKPFYSYRPTLQDFARLLENKKVSANRQALTGILSEQYQSANTKAARPFAAAVDHNIELLKADTTYTVTTGHQLNIFAGPLYFIYKIVTAIKLARQLKEAFPDKNFVPVYWMATEDHDFAEINYTSIGGKRVEWDFAAAGATGRLSTKTMRQALNQYKGVLGMEGFGSELADIIETAYTAFDKLADATRYLADALFGRYGLVIIDADTPELKQQFAPFIEQDILHQHSFKNISATDEELKTIDVHLQVNPREINFFYLLDNLRERLVVEDDRYRVLNTEISFSAEELKEEIGRHPERFSPNVVMRPLYQEVILPNIAYIGGGAEIVYWLQLKRNFDFYKVGFPILLLRNSGLVIRQETAAKINRLNFSAGDLFKDTDNLKNAWIKANSQHNLSLQEESREIQAIFERIKLRSYKIDATLSPSASAVQARLNHALSNLEKKLTRAEKRNYSTRIEQIDHIRQELFPKNSLQERTENFGLFYVKWGQHFIDELIRAFEPLDFRFTVLTE